MTLSSKWYAARDSNPNRSVIGRGSFHWTNRTLNVSQIGASGET